MTDTKLTVEPLRVRNVIILAHVDHGKTTLADNLLAYQGIVSPSQAGLARYLDSHPEEQKRGITIKSSSVLLEYSPKQSRMHLELEFSSYFVHLIDSPGHADFGGQVSSTASISDVALVVIDVVEGVCSQTQSSLRMAADNCLYPILVLNKIDRFIVELNMSSTEAYFRLAQLLEQVNALCSMLNPQGDDRPWFDPRRGNVVFASAVDGWGFRTILFSNIYSSKLRVPRNELNQGLWGSYVYKNSRIEASETGTPLFVKLILDNIWSVYRAVILDHNVEQIAKTCRILGLDLERRYLESRDPQNLLKTIMRAWIPCPLAVFDSIIDNRSDPCSLSRLAHYLGKIKHPVVDLILQHCRDNQISHGPCLVYINKLLPFVHHADDSDDSMAMGRVLSGTIGRNESLYFIYHDPFCLETRVKKVRVEGLYVLMGDCTQPASQATAGHIVGISGLLNGNVFAKYGILTDIDTFPAFRLGTASSPMIKVCVEPTEISRLSQLQEALLLLYRSDPSLEIGFSDKGETILAVSGQLHLDHIVEELAKISPGLGLEISEPIVPYRETVCAQTKRSAALPNHFKNLGGIRIRHDQDLASMDLVIHHLRIQMIAKILVLDEDRCKALCELGGQRLEVQTAIEKLIKEWYGSAQKWLWGWNGTNLLISTQEGHELKWKDSMVAGFKLATNIGPLLGEPMHGVGFLISGVKCFDNQLECPFPTDGALMALFRDGFHRLFLDWSPRLMLAVNSVVVQTTTRLLGKLSSISSKHQGCITSEKFMERTGYLYISLQIPVINYPEFSREIHCIGSECILFSAGFSGFQMVDTPIFSNLVDLDQKNKMYQYFIRVRKLRGMFIDEKIVESGEKQRTLKR